MLLDILFGLGLGRMRSGGFALPRTPLKRVGVKGLMRIPGCTGVREEVFCELDELDLAALEFRRCTTKVVPTLTIDGWCAATLPSLPYIPISAGFGVALAAESGHRTLDHFYFTKGIERLLFLGTTLWQGGNSERYRAGAYCLERHAMGHGRHTWRPTIVLRSSYVQPEDSVPVVVKSGRLAAAA